MQFNMYFLLQFKIQLLYLNIYINGQDTLIEQLSALRTFLTHAAWVSLLDLLLIMKPCIPFLSSQSELSCYLYTVGLLICYFYFHKFPNILELFFML